MKRTIRKIKFHLRRRTNSFTSAFHKSRRAGYARSFKKYVFSKNFARLAFFSLISGFGMLLALFGYFAKDLPDPNKINAREIKQTTVILDRNGKKLYNVYGDIKRTLIPFEEIPKACKDATLAKEDRDFYKHRGFVPRSFARALTSNVARLFGRGNVQGGSTITQQLVKNVLLTPEQTIVRKIKELILAIEIEQLYKKDDIFRIYLNEIPYGSNAYGIEAAANTYFNKKAKDLTIEECALLSVLPQAPTLYSPYGQRKAQTLQQKDYVIDEMAKEGYITKEQAEVAKKKELVFATNKETILAPHFTLYVREQLVAKYGEKLVTEGGLKVTTTIDYGLFELAQNAINNNNKNMSANKAGNASLVSIDPKTGQVLVMVGSKDYFDTGIDGNVNVSLTLQQPGSSLKPIVYGALMKGPDRWGRTWGPGSVLYDINTDFGGSPAFRPKNYDNKDHGIVTIRKALDNSYNIPAAKALYLAGIDDTVKQLKEMGYKSSTIDTDRCGLSLVLGGCEVTLLEHTNGYAILANGGVRHEPVTILKVEDSNGKILEEWKPTEGQKVFDEQVAYLVSDMISDVGARAPTFGASTFNIGRKAGAKTGTTDDFKDAWTMGYVPQLATGVWVGNNNNAPLKRAGTGAMVAEPIWRQFMKEAVKRYPNEWIPRPKGIKEVDLDDQTGAAPDAGTVGTHRDIFPEWFKPIASPPSPQTYVYDIVSGGMADLNNCPGGSARAGEPRTPADAQGKIFTGRIMAEIPSSDPAFARWQAAVSKLGGGSSQPIPTTDDSAHKCSDSKVEISSVSLSKSGAKIKISATIKKGTFGILKAQFIVDGVQKGEVTASSCSGSSTLTCEFLIDNPGSGSHTYLVHGFDTGLYRASKTESKDTILIL